MYCSNCGTELATEYKYCPNCGIQHNQSSNSIASGNNSFNAISSELKDNSIHIGDNYTNSNNIDPSILNLKRHFVSLPWSSSKKITNMSSILNLGTWGSIASIIGLIPYSNNSNHILNNLFMLCFGLSFSIVLLSILLKRTRFSHFFGLKNFEVGKKNGIYLTEITCDCPWCGSLMKLRMTGPKNQKEHLLLCERNPAQHRIVFDPTVMPDINE